MGDLSPGDSWTDPIRRRWDSLPSERRRDLDRVLRLLPGSLRRWRGLLEAGLTQVRQTAGDRKRVAIVGPPNAGKSTLYNRLIVGKQPKAAVSSRPGTTQVVQEGDVGVFAVVDTPGAAPEMAEGQVRAFEAARQADVLVILFDGSQPVGTEERKLLDDLRGLGKPWVVALNKMDAVPRDRARVHGLAAHALGLEPEQLITVSALSGTGLERLLVAVAQSEPEIVAALGETLPAYRGALARAATSRAASTAAAISLTPLPMISFIPLIGVQSALVLSLARIYGYRITLARARELLVTFGIGMLARTLFYELIKIGGPPAWLVSAAVAAGATTALGYAASAWFDRGEKISAARLKEISQAVGTGVIARLRGRRKPRKQAMEEEVRVVLEGTGPPDESEAEGPGL